MESGGLSAGDILALTKNNSAETMGGAGYFWWVIIFFIIAGVFGGGNLFGNRGTAENALLGEDEFIKRDIFSTNQNVSNTACQTQRDVLESRYTTQLGLQQLGSQAQNCCCETQKEIIQSRYDNALGQSGIQKDILLGNKDMQAQLATCCCDLRTAIHAEGEATRNMIQQDKIEQLRDSLNSATQAYNNLTLANSVVSQVRPFPQPAYITCSPYQSYGFNYGYGCGCGCN